MRTTDGPSTSKTKRESTDSGDAQDTTDVSETDMDITEQETVPYSRSPHQEASVLVEDPSALLNVGLEAERKEESPRMPAGREEEDDDDGFQLVREIFFS